MFYRITTGRACCDVETKKGVVVNAAPIARWTIGKCGLCTQLL